MKLFNRFQALSCKSAGLLRRRSEACRLTVIVWITSALAAIAQTDCCVVLDAGDTNVAIMQTGGFLTLQTRTRPVQIAPVPGTYSLSFSFGFATEETPIDGEILDSITLVMENTNSGVSAVLFTADANSYGWLPFSPGLFPSLDASVVLSPAVSPPLALALFSEVAFTATFTVPAALATDWTDVTMLLYDYPNGLNSAGWMGPITVIAPPGKLEVISTGLLRSFGPYQGIFAPLTRNYTLTNSGGSKLNWRVSPSANWLTATPAVGDLDWGKSTNMTLTVNNRARLLPPGIYTNQVAFLNDSVASNTVTQKVELVVIAPPFLEARNGAAPGQVNLRLIGTALAAYRIEAAPDFSSWTPIYTNTTASDGSYTYTGQATQSRRFYRASFVYP